MWMLMALYYLFLAAVAVCTVIFNDFLIPGIAILLVCFVSSEIRRAVWKKSYQLLYKTQEQLKSLDTQYNLELPMARITYANGDIVEIGNLENDYKVGENMRLYVKDKKKNKWILQQDVVAVEFYIHDLDPVTIIESHKQ